MTAYVINACPTRGRTGGVVFRVEFRVFGCWRTARRRRSVVSQENETESG
jgi:hypothetical protein